MSRESMPFGIGEQAFQNLPQEQREERISFGEVKNEVEWVNEDILLPTKLEVGAPTKLGIFLSPKEEDRTVKVHTGHYRTALIGRAIFEDKQGRRYRDLDAKGTGRLTTEQYHTGRTISAGWELATRLKVDNENAGGLVFDGKKTRSPAGPWGFCMRQEAEHDRDMTEELLAKGIRTYRIAAIIDLKEMIDNKGERISIEEARRRGVLEDSDDPVIQLRAFTTKMRIGDAASEPVFLEDGMAMVAQELGKAEIGNGEYAHWMAKTLGEQIGRMHSSGYIHDYIKGNVTVDCNIIDNDGVRRKKDMLPREFKDGIKKDLLEAKQELVKLYGILEKKDAPSSAGEQNLSAKALISEFEQAYKKAFPGDFWKIFPFKAAA